MTRSKHNTWKHLLLGKVSGKYMLWMLLLTLLLFAIGNLWSYFLYPEDSVRGSYSIIKNSVSSLGNQEKNPQGSLIWRLSFIFGGLSIIPVINYLYHRLQPVANITSKMFWISSVVASICVSLVGVFPENAGLIHYIFAILAFFAYMFGFCCNLYTFSKMHRENYPRFSIIPVIILYIFLIGSMIGFIVGLILFGLWYFYGLYWINIYLPLWEWLVLIAELVYIIGIFCIIAIAEKN